MMPYIPAMKSFHIAKSPQHMLDDRDNPIL